MPSKEYYRKLKKEAHDLYVREGMTCKEISTRIKRVGKVCFKLD